MPESRVITDAAARRMIALSRERVGGKLRYSVAELADLFGIGETTAHRIVKGRGIFTRLHEPEAAAPEAPPDEGAAASLARLLADHPDLAPPEG